MPLRDKTVPCPACAGNLLDESDQGIQYARCPACGGVWIAEQAFFSLLRHRHPDARIDEVMVHNDGSPRVGCPICQEPMDIGWLDFLQIDRCEHAHGLWFEAGELERALAYDIGQDVVEVVKKRAALRKNKQGR
ncbi:MAG: zf-TFIIB domain-containing protein [Deltaproteobacteria bacterium]|nr:zf-TFIIB domain-containing protein [Deltaproteobacteria bacterium]